MKRIYSDYEIKRYREKAVKEVNKMISKLTNEDLDSLARKLFALPDRPEKHQPFVGWMNPIREKGDDSNIKGMKASERCVSLIKKWEGFSSHPYRCPGGVMTIGYGHTKNVYSYNNITKIVAHSLLLQDLIVYENAVKSYVKVNLTQNQFDALVSFTYNLGGEALRKSTLLKKVNQGKYLEAAQWFDRYVYAGKQKLPGLILRRKDEKDMFLGI